MSDWAIVVTVTVAMTIGVVIGVLCGLALAANERRR